MNYSRSFNVIAVLILLCIAASQAHPVFLGPLETQLGSRQMQAQREYEFLVSCLKYLQEEGVANDEERKRVVGILTAGGFSSRQLSDAVYYSTKSPSGSLVDNQTLTRRKEIAELMLHYGRTTHRPVDEGHIRMMNVEDMGLYVEIDGNKYTGDAAAEMYDKIRNNRQLAQSWDRVELVVREIERIIDERATD